MRSVAGRQGVVGEVAGALVVASRVVGSLAVVVVVLVIVVVVMVLVVVLVAVGVVVFAVLVLVVCAVPVVWVGSAVGAWGGVGVLTARAVAERAAVGTGVEAGMAVRVMVEAVGATGVEGG